MSIKSKIKAFAIAQGIVALVKDANKKGTIQELVAKIDAVADKDLGSRSEAVQLMIAEGVLIPIIKELLKESPEKYVELLSQSLLDASEDVSQK